ncbi:MAG: D-alanine--D-alanine ligase [Phycisphaeraceae bacterium]|nr:D-alanine--D-alanine ligase [Phycisphaeraceae bacterium]
MSNAFSSRCLRILVLAGGPDRERPVSLQSGKNVADALQQAGHQVTLADVMPDDFSAVDRFIEQNGDVIFPILHGGWGEGGGLQQQLDQRKIPYVGCRAKAAALCMDKLAAKQLAIKVGLSTPDFELVPRAGRPSLAPPVVVKPTHEGSSIHMAICQQQADLDEAWAMLSQHYPAMLVERYLPGAELTVGILGSGDEAYALPVIHIVPAAAFYDYEAKYNRDDTRYRFDFDPHICKQAQQAAVALHRAADCRHLSRVDFIVDKNGRPQFIEINTLPGFTAHSLLPMAARQTGLTGPALTDQLVRMALRDAQPIM